MARGSCPCIAAASWSACSSAHVRCGDGLRSGVQGWAGGVDLQIVNRYRRQGGGCVYQGGDDTSLVPLTDATLVDAPCFQIILITERQSKVWNVHTTQNTPVLVRSPKISWVGPD